MNNNKTKTPEDKVEKIIEEFNEFNADKGGLLYPNRNENWLRKALLSHRQQILEEVERIVELFPHYVVEDTKFIKVDDLLRTLQQMKKTLNK